MWWRSSVVLVAVVVVVAACSDPPAGDAPETTSAATSTTTPATVPPTVSTSGTVAPTVSTSLTVAPAEPTAPATTGVAPAGFALVPGRATAADGSTCDVCLWLAATPEDRSRGLMGVTDLSGADGMVFTWDAPTTGNFWMRDTPTPLSIAFFDADGTFVSATDMSPCLAPTLPEQCPRFPAAGPYLSAVEVVAGGLPALLMVPGSRFELLDGECPDSA